MTEEQRIAGIEANIKQLLDEAANDISPCGIIGFGKVWLAAELVAGLHQVRIRNEQTNESTELQEN